MIDNGLTMYGAIESAERVWFSNNKYNGLFSVNKHSFEVEFVDFFPNEERIACALHKKVNVHNDYIFFAPALSNNIAIYNTKKMSFEQSIPIERKGKEYTSGTVAIDKKLWIFPLYADQEVFCIDMEKLSYVKSHKIMEECISELGYNTTEILMTRISIYKENIIFGLYKSDIIGLYDYRKGLTEFIHTGINNIFAAIAVEDQIWIITNDSDEVFLWDEKSRSYSSFKLEYSCNNQPSRINRPCNNIISFDGKVILLPSFSDDVLALNIDKGVFNSIGVKMSIQEENNNGIRSFGSCIVDGHLWILPFNSSDGYSIDSNLKYKHIDFVIADENVRRNVTDEYMAKNEGMFHESDSYDLKDFLHYVSSLKQ